jgi:hypothetical protein
MGLLLILGIAHGCAEATEKPKGATPPAPVLQDEGASAAAPKGKVNHFEWKVRVTTPTLKDTETQVSQTTGEIALGFGRWSCNYTIENRREPDGPRQEFGFVSCRLGSTGEAVETMVLCMEHENRPSDCGTGVLRISDDAGQLHQLELSCRSASSDCAKRPVVTDALFAGATGSARTRPASTGPMKHFQWRLEINDGSGGTSAKQLSSRRGDIESPLKGWQCSYSITQQTDTNYPELELGYTTCKSKSSTDTVETVLLCAENAERPSACNMGRLRMGSDGGGVHSITMSCKNPDNPCW